MFQAEGKAGTMTRGGLFPGMFEKQESSSGSNRLKKQSGGERRSERQWGGIGQGFAGHCKDVEGNGSHWKVLSSGAM